MYESVMFDAVTVAGGVGTLFWVIFKVYNYKTTEPADWPIVCLVLAIAGTLIASGSTSAYMGLYPPMTPEATQDTNDFDTDVIEE